MSTLSSSSSCNWDEDLFLFKRLLASEKKSPDTIEAYVRYVSNFLDECDFSSHEEITDLAIRDYCLDLFELSVYSDSVLNSIQSSIIRFVELVLFRTVNSRCLPHIRVIHAETPFFTHDQVSSILHAVSVYVPSKHVRKKTPDSSELMLIRQRLTCAVLLGFDCGLRFSEVIQLRIEDVQPSSRGSLIFIYKSKRNKSRHVKYSMATLKALRRLLVLTYPGNTPIPNSGYIYPGKKDGNHLSPATLAKYFRDMMATTQFSDKNYRFHSFRHSFAMDMISSGINPYELATLLGHSAIQTTMNYFHQTHSVALCSVTPGERWLNHNV